MKKRLIFLGFLTTSVLINIIILCIFKDNFIYKENLISSQASLFAFFSMIIIFVNGVLSYFYRRTANFLSFATRRSLVLIGNRFNIYTKEYRQEFYWQFVLYWCTIPFFIPCILLSTKGVHALWTLALIFIPQFVYFANEIIIPSLKQAKKSRLIRLKEEKELKEQQKREELGKFK